MLHQLYPLYQGAFCWYRHVSYFWSTWPRTRKIRHAGFVAVWVGVPGGKPPKPGGPDICQESMSILEWKPQPCSGYAVAYPSLPSTKALIQIPQLLLSTFFKLTNTAIAGFEAMATPTFIYRTLQCSALLSLSWPVRPANRTSRWSRDCSVHCG